MAWLKLLARTTMPLTLALGAFVNFGVIKLADKIFKTYKEQQKILTDRGLVIKHPRRFTNAMQNDDYYNVITENQMFSPHLSLLKFF